MDLPMRDGDAEASDDDLARRAQGGSAQSLDALYRRFQVPLLRFLRRRVTSDADAEDLVQETFVRVYQQLHRYDAGRPFKTWLFTIGFRLAMSHHRNTSTLSAEGRRHMIERANDDTSRDPSAGSSQKEQTRQLWDVARDVLSAEQFAAVWLYYVEGIGTHELTEVLGRSWPSVKVMLFRARAKLQPHLKSMMDADETPPSSRHEQVESDDDVRPRDKTTVRSSLEFALKSRGRTGGSLGYC